MTFREDATRIIIKNQDVVVFIAMMLKENKDTTNREITQRVYEKFGSTRFARKGMILMLLANAGKEMAGGYAQ